MHVVRASPHAVMTSAIAEAVHLAVWLRDSHEAHQEILGLSQSLAGTLSSGGRILACGNGGSMCDAMHFAEELSGRFRRDRPALAAQALSDPAHLTCVGNDHGFDQVFARCVEAWGRKGDALLVFSTSGNSPNVVAAAEFAHRQGLAVHGLLGRDGGRVGSLCDRSLRVPGATPDRIQEVHIKVVHLLIELIEERLFGIS
jgi:D-sedoheptulose 7-phosphate isomerase